MELKQMLGEVEDLSRKISDSSQGLSEQVATILSMPPPRVLYQGQRAWPDDRTSPLPPGRSTLQAPKRGRSHARKGSGDKKSGTTDRRGFNSTL